MMLRAENTRLDHRVIGTKHVVTSPDVPYLHVSHSDKQAAFDSVQSALDMFELMEKRTTARQAMNEIKREAAVDY